MQLLRTLHVPTRGGEHRAVQLFHGDLTQLAPQNSVDVLVVSAFPNDYAPTDESLIGALQRKLNLSVSRLALDKDLDLTSQFSCWLSKAVRHPERVGFRRLLCFEPERDRKARSPAEQVGDVFRSLLPTVYDLSSRPGALEHTQDASSAATVAMPLLAAGDQGHDEYEMAVALVDAAVHWLELGVPLATIKIVELDAARASSASRAFDAYEREHPSAKQEGRRRTKKPRLVDRAKKPTMLYDVFISYSRKDERAAEKLLQHLRDKSLKVFVDRHSIDKGSSWQAAIFEALDQTRRIIPIYSPAYFASDICKEEFNVGYAIRRERKGALVPVFLHDTPLPTFIKLVDYFDAREGTPKKLATIYPQVVDACCRM